MNFQEVVSPGLIIEGDSKNVIRWAKNLKLNYRDCLDSYTVAEIKVLSSSVLVLFQCIEKCVQGYDSCI